MKDKIALIIGAKSDIAKAIAHRFAKDGWNFYLAGRNKNELDAIGSDLHIRYGIHSASFELDVMHFKGHENFYAALNPKPDLVICVAGLMPLQSEVEKDAFLVEQVIGTNFTGCAILLNLAANEMEKNIMETTVENILAEQREDIRNEANLPFEEKIRILIRMQIRAAGMRPDLNWAIWSIPEWQYPRPSQG